MWMLRRCLIALSFPRRRESSFVQGIELGPRLRGDDQSAHQSHRALALLVLALLGGLVACGFQLRGEQTLPFSAVFVNGNSSYLSVAQLRQSVAKVPRTRLVTSLAEADAELKIVNETRERVISALSAAGRVREYELRLRISYLVIDKQGNELIAPSEVQLFRLVPYDETQVLSKGQEEALLYTDMQNDAVAQIMRRLAAAKPRT